MNKYRICIVEPLEKDGEVMAAAQKLKKEKQIAFVFSSCGTEYRTDKYTCFIVKDFEGPVFDNLHRHEAKIMGPTALKMAANGDERINIAEIRRPLYSLALHGANVCFTRYRTLWEHMNRISRLVYHMGGRVRREMNLSTTHLIAHSPGGEKYDYADTFKIHIMADTWVLSAWEKRHDAEFSATQDDVVTEHKLRLGGVKICFLGFSPEDTQTYKDYLVANNGAVCELSDPLCNHIVVNDKDEEMPTLPESIPASCLVVKSEWWWTTMENESYVDVKSYLLVEDANETPDGRQASTPGSAASRAKKRKRLQQLAGYSGSPARGKRRSSANTLDFSGNYLDWTLTPDKDARDGAQKEAKPVSARQLKFYELVSTETNYVDILEVIVKSFKMPLEECKKLTSEDEMQENDESVNPILGNMEIKMIFGNLPPILDVHKAMLEELKVGGNRWTPDFAIGEVFLKRAAEIQKAYPPFINSFEKSVETLNFCEKTNPRFHAFLKIRQNKPECGRQSLKELLIRPVQRLPSISLLLGDLLKHTDEKHPDHTHLNAALATIKEVMTHINEDKRRTEAQVATFELFNQIDNCPPELISGTRTLVLKCECLETTDGRKGDPVTLLLFTDILEICCKRRIKNFTLRGTKSLQKCAKSKPYKHLRHIRLSHIKRVVSLNDSEECQNAFALEVLNNDRLQDPNTTLGAMDDDIILVPTFSLIDDVLTKPKFLQLLCQQTATNCTVKDPLQLLDNMDKADLIMEEAPKPTSHSLTKAFRFASNAKTKMGRALSLSRTPSRASRIMPRRTDSTASADHSPGIAKRLERGANLNDSIVSLHNHYWN